MEFKGTGGIWGFEIDEFFDHAWLESNKHGRILEIQPTTSETPYDLLLCSKAPEMLKMLQRIDSKKTVTFDDLLEIKKLIKEVTSINEP